jgi:hypothetical protein
VHRRTIEILETVWEYNVQETIKSAELGDEALWRLGQDIYDRTLKAKLEPAHRGEFVVINVANGDYFVDPDEERAIHLAQTRYPDEVFYIGRVGYPAVDWLGHHAAS